MVGDALDQLARPPARSTAREEPTGELARAHLHARERGVSERLYAVVRLLLRALLRGWFHAHIGGCEHIPSDGPAIVACNHKSFLDALFIGIATHRHVRFMAKAELFRGPLGWLLLRLGAFPVRRGATDAESIETATLILEQGGVVVLFPEGTRVEDRRVLGSPHHGAGRLALQTGAPLIPAAISGTQHLWIGPVPKPRRVQLSFLAPMQADRRGASRTETVEPTQLPAGTGAVTPADADARAEAEAAAIAELVDEQLWPAVRREYGSQLARPGLILAALAAGGIGVRALARRRAQPPPRLLGVVPSRKARRRRMRTQLAKAVRKRLP